MPKQTSSPAARFLCVHSMNRSYPSTVVGGGVMKRETSSVESIASRVGASDSCSSRSVMASPARSGRRSRQSDEIVSGWGTATAAEERTTIIFSAIEFGS